MFTRDRTYSQLRYESQPPEARLREVRPKFLGAFDRPAPRRVSPVVARLDGTRRSTTRCR